MAARCRFGGTLGFRIPTGQDSFRKQPPAIRASRLTLVRHRLVHTDGRGAAFCGWIGAVAQWDRATTVWWHLISTRTHPPSIHQAQAQGSVPSWLNPTRAEPLQYPRSRSEIIRRRVAEDKGSGTRLAAVWWKRQRGRCCSCWGILGIARKKHWFGEHEVRALVRPISLIERCRAARQRPARRAEPGNLASAVRSVIITARRAISHQAGLGAACCVLGLFGGGCIELGARRKQSIRDGGRNGPWLT